MTKDCIKREKTHDKYMKQVIIRLDYTGVRDVSSLVNIFDKKFPKSFKQSSDYFNTELSLSLSREMLKDVSDTINVPLNVIQKEKVVRYRGLKNVSCDVILDISPYYMCMTINCNENYDGLDNYIYYFKGAITLFTSSIEYFSPKRLGLRKIRVEKEQDIQSFKNVFESFVFNIPDYSISPIGNLKSEYIDCIEKTKNNNIKFNIRRRIQRLNEQEKNGSYEGKIYAATLDIDAYYKDEKNGLNRINELLNNANLLEFEIYKACMKESYLLAINER